MNIQQFWSDVLAQRADEIREYFHSDAYVNWHCSNEHFTVEEFIRANCEYPGDWDGEVEKIVTTDDMVITATRVYPKDRSASFHVTSFIKLKDDHIKLGQALKAARLAASGVEAKLFILDGKVKVNGTVCLQRGKKLFDGDTVDFEGKTIKIRK